MAQETVSVIIAVFNAEKYLDSCIESVCGQNYSDLEIILVDDGSGDASGAICDRWADKDSRVKAIHQKNSGVSVARNRGIDAAEGAYVVFVDSDDRLEPDFVRELMDSHRQGQMTVTAYRIDYEGRKNKSLIRKYGKDDICLLEDRDIIALFQSGLFSPIWNKLYERRLIGEDGVRFCETMNLGEDIVFNLHYAGCISRRICVVNKPLYHYMRRGGESLDNSYNEQYAAIQKKIYSEFFRFIDGMNSGCHERNILLGLYFNALVTAMDNLYVCRKKWESSVYRRRMKERIEDSEFLRLVGQMEGAQRRIYGLRYFFLSHGFYVIDYYLRKLLKVICRLE